MGRSDRIAPRICPALELRTQVASMALMSLVLPSSTVTLSKPGAVSGSSSSGSSPPSSPDTPGQSPPACVTSQEAWPQDLLQLMQQQVAVLSSHSSSNGGGGNEEHGKRKRDCQESDQENLPLEKLRCDMAAGGRVEVELHAQSPLPEEWEQLLDLKTGELYYFHWGSCKRAKSDPRELVRQANESVLALELKARARCMPKDNDPQESYIAAGAGAGAAAPADVGTSCTDLIASSETDNGCLQESSSQGSPAGEVESAQSEEEKLSKCDDDDPEEESNNCEKGMVALSCNHCTMFVLLSLSSPSCPSCGEYLHADS